MFGIGTGELLVLLVLALLVLGPERMPRLARDIGKTVGDLRRTSDELRQEFLSADAIIDKAASIGEPIAMPKEVEVAGLPGGATEVSSAPADQEAEAVSAPAEATAEAPAEEAAGPVTQAAVAEAEPDETAFDKEARLARQRLDDPARAERAKAEGWPTPTDDAGTNTDRWS